LAQHRRRIRTPAVGDGIVSIAGKEVVGDIERVRRSHLSRFLPEEGNPQGEFSSALQGGGLDVEPAGDG
jgi:hypothetical protein